MSSALIRWAVVVGLLSSAASAMDHPTSRELRFTDKAVSSIEQRNREQVSRLIVRFSENVKETELFSHVRQMAAASGIPLGYRRRLAGGMHLLNLSTHTSLAAAEQLSMKLEALPGVMHVSPDQHLDVSTVPSDSRFNEQWNLMGLDDGIRGGANFVGAWDTQTGNSSVVVAVLDTGISPHVDIDTTIRNGTGKIARGFDFVTDLNTAGDGNGRDSDPTDPGDYCSSKGTNSSWHGTHVAGTIAALTDNTAGVAGGGWKVRIQPIRVLGRCGGTLSDIIDGIYWAAGRSAPSAPLNAVPVSVINLSVGSTAPAACPAALKDAIQAATDQGLVLVAAAGNSSGRASAYWPVNCPNVIGVHAHTEYGQYATYSNFGSAVDISAPGGSADSSCTSCIKNVRPDSGILSTVNPGTTTPASGSTYSYKRGTSMAAPHVSAAAALLFSEAASLSPGSVLSALTESVQPFPQYGDEDDCNTIDCGRGMLDIGAALANRFVYADPPDQDPDPFDFGTANGVAKGANVTSSGIHMYGINMRAPISVTNGSFSINGGSFSNRARTIHPGDKISLRHKSATMGNTTVTTTLTVGNVSGSFSSTTAP